MIDFVVAYDKLANLQEAEEIANLFRGYNVKAIPGESHACAISVWMKDQTNLDIVTNREIVRAVTFEDDYICYKTVSGMSRALTYAMRQFIWKFDQGLYPELIEFDCE